jgi:hypothetical protein
MGRYLGQPGAALHFHRRVVPRTARFLTMISPPGFEGFFRELSEAAKPELSARSDQS